MVSIFNRELHASAIRSGGASAAAVLTRADELFREGETLIAEDNQEEAERALESCILLTRKGLGLPNAVAEGETLSDPNLAHYYSILAFSKQSLEKYAEASALYELSLPVLAVRPSFSVLCRRRPLTFLCWQKTKWNKDSHQLGVALLNFAEVQAMQRQFVEARKTCEEAARVLKANYGERNEIYASALSNLSAYLCQLGLYSDARPHARTALRVFMDLLGRDSDYTKSCWSNYYIILTRLNLKEEIKDLETEWKAAADTGSWLTGEKEVPAQVMENLTQKLEEQMTPPGQLDVGGFVKDPEFAKKELEQFVEKARANGISTEDPAFLDVLEHEVGAIMDGQHKTEEALQNATQRVSEMAEKMGPEWQRFIDQILVVAPSLDEAASNIEGAGLLDPEFVAKEKAELDSAEERERTRLETLARGAQARAAKAHIVEEQRRINEAEIRGSQFDD